MHPVWNKDFLSQLKFSSNRQLYDELKIEALKGGFDLASRQPLIQPYGAFYCTRGGRVKTGRSSKCGCTFQFKTTATPEGKIVVRIDETLELRHNHPLEVELLGHRVINDQLRTQIKQLYDAKVKPLQIKRYLEQQGHVFSTLQIQYIARTTKVKGFQAESDELVDYVNRNQGALTRVFEKQVDGELHRFAVLTFTEKELQNLKRYGDVLFIDGTFANLRLKWEVLPITSVNEHRELVCCGVFYASVTDEEVLTWLLLEIYRVLEPIGVLKSIATDEDAAFIAAFRNMLQTINSNRPNHVVIHHILCALHKQRNFMNKMVSCGLTKQQRELALDLFRKVCYHTNNDYAAKCLNDLKDMNAKLCKYVEKHVVPELPQFARSYMSGIYANGYNTTSPGESMNNLLKQGITTVMSLKESREHFDRVLTNHEENCRLRRLRRTLPIVEQGYMPAVAYRQLGYSIAKKLAKQCDIAEKIVLETKVDDVVFTHSAYHEEHPNTVYNVNMHYCTCNTIRFLGIPCSHLIKLYRTSGLPFPLSLVDKRWVINLLEQVPPPDAPEDAASDDSGAALSDSDTLSEGTGGDILAEVLRNREEEDDESDLPNDEELSQRELYLRLFHLGKTIASKASQSSATAKEISTKLRGILADLVELPPDPAPNDESDEPNAAPVVDVVDRVGRPRGRPKRMRNMVDRQQPKRCKICLRGHDTTKCFCYERWQATMEEYVVYEGGDRRCSLCTGPGHTIRTCPIRRDAQRHYEEQGES